MSITKGLKIRRPLRSWGFDPPPGTNKIKRFRPKMASRKREAIFRWWLFWWLFVFTDCPKWLFAITMVCKELQKVTFPGFPEHSRGRSGVKAAHACAASRS